MEEFGSVGDYDPGQAFHKDVLQFNLCSLKHKYFEEQAEIALKIDKDKTSMGCYLPSTDTIVLDPGIVAQVKTCQIVMLHELVHRKLYKENGDADEEHGERFQTEIRRLFELGAYRALL